MKYFGILAIGLALTFSSVGDPNRGDTNNFAAQHGKDILEKFADIVSGVHTDERLVGACFVECEINDGTFAAFSPGERKGGEGEAGVKSESTSFAREHLGKDCNGSFTKEDMSRECNGSFASVLPDPADVVGSGKFATTFGNEIDIDKLASGEDNAHGSPNAVGSGKFAGTEESDGIHAREWFAMAREDIDSPRFAVKEVSKTGKDCNGAFV